MSVLNDYTGSRNGRLVVKSEAARIGKYVRCWNCQCDCGNTVVIRLCQLTKTFSCGCLRNERVREATSTHGMSRSTEYKIWSGILKRCYNAGNHAYDRYGGRGIIVCDRWRHSFPNFYSDMGGRPSDQHSVERRDNDGPYSPENCYWATVTEQANNKRNNVVIEYNGASRTMAEWARELGIGSSVLQRRLKRGWSVKSALTTSPEDARRRDRSSLTNRKSPCAGANEIID